MANKIRMEDAVAYNLRLPRPVYDALREAAFRRHVSINTAVAMAVDEWLGRAIPQDLERVPQMEREYLEPQEDYTHILEMYQKAMETQRRIEERIEENRVRRSKALAQVAKQLAALTQDEPRIKSAS